MRFILMNGRYYINIDKIEHIDIFFSKTTLRVCTENTEYHYDINDEAIPKKYRSVVAQRMLEHIISKLTDTDTSVIYVNPALELHIYDKVKESETGEN